MRKLRRDDAQEEGLRRATEEDGRSKDGKNIAADELVQDQIALGFDGKRDRYNGYDAEDYGRVVDRYEKAEALKAEVAKRRELERAYRKANRDTAGDVPKEDGDASDDASSGSDSDDDAKAADADAEGFMEVKKRVRSAGGGASMTVRNLRIREDTAKYLRNLDLSSAYYDPKTRSMRENPTPQDDPSSQFALQFQGDNVTRKTGETLGFERLNRHAFDAYQKGQEIHMQAAPSQAELLYKQFKEKKEALSGVTKSAILEKYGNAAASEPAPEGLLLGQTEGYVEYDRAGRVIKGQERATAKSRYEEDVHEQNHTKVWGSFWQAGRWGYACCRSFQKNSYCTGKKGLDAADAAADLMKENLAAREAAMEARRGRRRRLRRGRRTRAGRTGRGRRRRTRSTPRRTCGAATSPRTFSWIRRSWRRRSGERMLASGAKAARRGATSESGDTTSLTRLTSRRRTWRRTG